MYLYSLIEFVRPKLVITYIDNDWHFQYLAKICKNSIFFAIQNGVRSRVNLEHDLPKKPHPGSKIFHKYFFCFGNHEVKSYQKFGHFVEKFVPVGSLRLSWCLQKIKQNKLTVKNKPHILLISQWDEKMIGENLYPEFLYGIEKLNNFFKKFIDKHNVKLNIIPRSNSKK